ncbi:hypothetical protein glysoja_032843 [Glycine soja]|uniref:Replication protein A 70 kDa DNA-binding subunit B/D first OB fold domain-containing protein n=1 Tax=Glycine soja TaxID=3848 RepID=A0A0B2R2P2_GLYSO|nr:hypothetical protein glysoja_032843 [Glycine soja]
MSRKENLLCELHTKKGTWKIVVRITDMWRLNKHNGRQSIEMVLMNHTGTKIVATLWQELFPEFEPKLRCGGAYVIQNVKVVDTHSDYKVSAIKYLVYFVKTTSVKEVDRPEIPPNVHAITSFADIISGVAKPDTLVDVVGAIAEVIERKTVNPAYRVTVKLRDNKYKLVVKMEQNGEKANFHFWDAVCIKIFGKTVDECRQELIASGDEIKVFPACVDQLLGKTWVVRFKHRIQMHQSSVLDFSEQEHHIQSLISTLGLQVIITCPCQCNS